MPRQHVADAGDPAVWAADHGESLKGEGWPGTIAQQVFQTPKIARHIAVEERDPKPRRMVLRPMSVDANLSGAGTFLF